MGWGGGVGGWALVLGLVGAGPVGIVVGAALVVGVGVTVWVRGVTAGVSGALGRSVTLFLGVNFAEVVGDRGGALCVRELLGLGCLSVSFLSHHGEVDVVLEGDLFLMVHDFGEVFLSLCIDVFLGLVDDGVLNFGAEVSFSVLHGESAECSEQLVVCCVGLDVL